MPPLQQQQAPRETLWQYRNRKAQKDGPHATVYMPSGGMYKGDWHDNQRHGQGTAVYPNGNKYSGGWQAGQRHGMGTLWVLRGGRLCVRYSGEWRAGQPDGTGLLHEPDGSSYEGELRAGLRHGRGRAVAAAAGCHAQQQTAASSACCTGGAGGDVYEGGFENNQRHGPGTLMLPSGDLFEGRFENGVKHGPGTFFFVSKGCRYDGVWQHGTAARGTYSELQPATPGTRGALPNVELCSPEAVLEEACAEFATAAAAKAAAAAGGGQLS